MTTEEKKSWLENAEAEEILKTYESFILDLGSGDIKKCIEANENLKLIKAELIKRMTK